MALSCVLGRDIVSISRCATCDENIVSQSCQSFNCEKVTLQDKLPPVGTSHTLRLLWSCTGELDSLSCFYEPNHIVPVVKIGADATRTTPAVVPKAKHTKLNKISTFFKSLPCILSLIGLQFSHGSN